ncbi:MAG: hypothetical protein GXW96_03535 [Christensenellaceae bacterium]|nr:hypothetical protein [Christensenellaceae bacterium]
MALLLYMLRRLMMDAMPTVARDTRVEHLPCQRAKTVLWLDENTLSGLYEYGIIPQII